MDAILGFYVRSRFFRRSRMDTYIRGQRGRQATIDKLIGVRTITGPSGRGGLSSPRTRLSKQPGEEKHVLVGLGSSYPLFNKQLDAELRRRATVVDIDEHNTSQRSSKSHVQLHAKPRTKTTVTELEHVVTRGRRPLPRNPWGSGDPGTRRQVTRVARAWYNEPLLEGNGRRATSHAVRTARPPSKTTELWNRDVNAAIWMGFKLVLLARGWTEERLPDCLRRRNGGDLPPQPDFYQQTAH